MGSGRVECLGKQGKGVGLVWEEYMRAKVQSRYEVCGPFEEAFPFQSPSLLSHASDTN